MDIQVVELPSFPEGMTQISQTELRNSIMAPKINVNMEINDGVIFARKIAVGSQAWVHNIVWTATDYNTASWSSGTFRTADGTSTAISAGNTGNIAARTYIYFDKTAVLKTTTTYSDAVSDTKILLASVVAAADANAFCIIDAFGAPGTTIDGNKIVTGKIQSIDGKTYFDLDNKQIVMNDGSNNRVHLGYQSGGY